MPAVRIVLTSILLLAGWLPANAQSPPGEAAAEGGALPVRNFSPRDYGAAAQNWAAAVDERGLVYVGNQGGVLEHDGFTWRLIPTPANTRVSALGRGADGRIYAGGDGEIGYLEPDDAGRMAYVSLVDHLPEEHRGFSSVLDVYGTSHGVYFHSYYLIMRWRDGQLEAWPFERQHAIHRLFAVDDVVYATQVGRGLMRMQGDSLALILAGDRYAARPVMAMQPHPRGILVGETDGLMLYDGASFTTFASGIDEFLAQHTLFRAAALPRDRYAVWTYSGGGAVIDAEGNLLRIVDEGAGLATSKIYGWAADGPGNWWLGLEYGIARIEATAPFTHFDAAHGLLGTVRSITRHEGQLYVSTDRSVFVLTAGTPGRPARFEPVPGVGDDTGIILSTPSGLIVTSLDQAFVVRDGAAEPLVTIVNRSLALTPGGDTLYVGGSVGLHPAVLEPGGRWRAISERRTVPGGIASMAADHRGRLWLGTNAGGVLRFDYSHGYYAALAPDTVAFAGARTEVAHLWNDLVVMTDDGFLRLDRTIDRLAPYDALDAHRDAAGFGYVAQLTETAAALVSGSPPDTRFRLLRRASDGTIHREERPFPRWHESMGTVAHLDPDGTLWVGGHEGLFRIAPAPADSPITAARALVRAVYATPDSLLYGGHGALRLELAPALRALRFRYAAAPAGAPESVLFRTRMDGLDRHWGPWTAETQRDFTNLAPGRYVFRVQAQDAGGAVSEEAAFAFAIRPPWHGTGWARGLFALLAIGLVGVAARRGPAIAARAWARLPHRRVVSHYRLDRLIGSGGAGQVWLARNLGRRPGEPRDVAVKLLHAEGSSDGQDDRNRLVREAEVISSFSHPNIVRVYETGVWKETPYIAMELLRGETLHDRVKRDGAIPLETAWPMLLGVVDALAAVHEAGIVHRDVKSANVMLVPERGAVLMDFGLARGTHLTTLTQLGQLLGTLGYAAPEQAMGQEANARSDIFAFGVVAYETLTGRLPFEAPNEIAMLHAIFSQEPVPPAEVAPSIPEAVSALVLRLLAKDPAERPASAGEAGRLMARLLGK